MFLATTALEEFWDSSMPMLMLGEWCRRYSRRQVWMPIQHEVLPYPWDDRAALRRAYALTEQVYERQLTALSMQLNHLHGTSYDPRFWRIVLGPWLRYFVEILYERYTVLDAAAQSGRVTMTWVAAVDDTAFVPPDFHTLRDWSTTDEYNRYLYDRIIDHRRHLPAVPVTRLPPPPPPRAIARSRRPALVAGLNRITRAIPGQFRPIVFDVAYFPRVGLMELQLRLGQFGCIKTDQLAADDPPVDRDARVGLMGGEVRDDFDACLASMLPSSIPKVHVESFASTFRRARAHFPANPAAIFTAVAQTTDEAFKLWAASSAANGAHLLIGQHGGHDGTGEFSSTESHERRIADTYISWGSEGEHVTALPAPLLARGRGRRPPRAGPIYWNLNIAPRYGYRLFSIPIGPQWKAYLDAQVAFAGALSAAVRQRLVCRPHPADYGWDVEERLRDALPGLIFERPGIQWLKRLTQASLAVETTNLTTLLQSLSADVPTVIYFNPAVWELRSAARDAFAALRDAGVYCWTAEEAAERVNAVAGDSRDWWQSAEVQRARRRFCDAFARRSRRWPVEWARTLGLLEPQIEAPVASPRSGGTR